ncbi:mucus-binding protein [Levilactobacillus zymae]|uniref:Mucus-binding protein n=1 Tax=Levilactobacillus zymae TaxID=267363 RepID=A0ABQ0WWT3_9LACO|nr:MucBP domain-containing protein [Levilactobacillus zymae]KRL06848.1 hypothetical protein FD38_GL000717 [Levilactobacillus zymae DSM 19395]GEO72219.1 mucus-binding protein [Levilactobacillus zymae]
MNTKKLLSKKMRQNRWVLTSAAAMTLAFMSLGGTVAHAETTENDNGSNETTTTTTSTTQSSEVTLSNPTTEPTQEPATTESTAEKSVTDPTGNDPVTTEKSTAEPTTTEPATTESTPDVSTDEPTTEDNDPVTDPTTTDPETPAESATDPVKAPEESTMEKATTEETTTPPVEETTVTKSTDDQSPEPVNDAATAGKTMMAAKAAMAPVAETAALTDAAESIDEWMPNKKLQDLVLKTLQKNNPGRTWNSAADITQEDMALLTRLSGDDETYLGEGVDYSLEGLQYATNLQYLLLQSRQTTAYYGGIVDLSPLADLQNLTELQLTGNRIKDVTPLAGLKNLKSLGLTLNEIGDFSPLKDNQYTSFYGGQQVIYLPSILVNSVTRTAHLDGGYKLQDGTTVALTGRSIAVPVIFNDKTNQFTYKFYFIGGNAVQASDGGLDFNTVQDPDAYDPITTYPGAIVVPVDHYYYLTGAYVEDGTTYFYVIQPYELANPAATVTAKYQDEQGNEIAPSVVLNQDQEQLVGATYTTTAAAVDGYTLKETTGAPVTGTYAATAQTVIYVYTRDQGTVTVHYVDDQGNVLQDPLTVTGNQGENYTTEAADIPYYTLTTTPANATGVYGKDPVSVTYVYTRDQGTITVHYVDDQGNVLQDPLTVTGNQGENYTTEAADIPYYTLTTTPANATGVYGKDPVSVTYVYTRDQGTITVHYVDDQGNVLQDPVTITGNQGENYTTEAADIPYYTLTTTPANATGVYGKDPVSVTYVYTRDQGTITVHYVDDQGNVLQDPLTVTGNQGENYTTEAADIPYYTLTTTPANATGVYGKDPVTVTYVYTRDQGTVTVHYVDDQGNVLQDPLTVTGNQGENYTTEAADIPYYTLTTTPANATGVYGKDPVSVTYVYTRDQGTVLVHYVDAQGNALKTPVTLTGNQGDAYTTEAADIPYYTLTTTPANATGTYGSDTINVTYVYTQDQGTVTVHYVDAQGNSLKDALTMTGNQGDTYTTEAAEIPYYTLSTTPTNATGVYGKEAVIVTYVYTRDQGTVTTHYVDEDGNVLQAATTVTGNQGDAYTTEAVDIPGYTLTSTPANATGTYGAAAIDVTYVYRKDATTPVTPPVTTGTVTVHYVDAQGNVLQAPTTLTGTVGDAYTTTAATIAGYQLTTTPANASGTYTAGNQDVTYVYTQMDEQGGGGDTVDPEQPTKPTDPTKPTTPTTTKPDQVTTGGSADTAAGNQRPAAVTAPRAQQLATDRTTRTAAGTPTNQSRLTADQPTTDATKLPQTDEQAAPTGWLAGGLGLLLSLLGLAGWRKKSE